MSSAEHVSVVHAPVVWLLRGPPLPAELDCHENTVLGSSLYHGSEKHAAKACSFLEAIGWTTTFQCKGVT